MDDEAARKIEAGFRAREIQESSWFRETIARLDALYVEAWKAADTVELREDAHRYMRLLEYFQQDFINVATTGQLEQARIDALTKPNPQASNAQYSSVQW